MRRYLLPLLTLAILLHPATFAAQTTTTVTILQLNDVYQISPVDRGLRGGLARVATLHKRIRSESPNTIFMLAGDFISPSVASRLFKGRQMIETLNAAGLEIATFGNHEFDFGPDTLLERMKESAFSYVVANVIDRTTGKPFGNAHPWLIRRFGDVRVGIFGLLLPETATLSSSGPGVRFDDPVRVGSRISRDLRRRGADIVVALTHLPMRDDKRLAAEADVDLIVGGHEHEVMQSLVGRTLILKMGSDARYLGRIDVNLTRQRGSGRHRIASIDWEAVEVTDSVPEDPEVAAVVASFERELGESLGETIGETTVELEARAGIIRRGESNLGNFLADVYREALDADIALVNSGSIRSDTTYGPGPITRKDVLSILPFENTLVKVRISGDHLKRVLENGVSVAGQEDGRFPQVSGLTFSYDPAKPVGSRVIEVRVSGEPIEYEATYTVALTAYVMAGGDGYDFKGAEVLIKPEEGPVEPDVVMEEIIRRKTIAPRVEGRITSRSGPTSRAYRRFPSPVPRARPAALANQML